MVREEGKREKMKTRLGRRAMGYEKKLEKRNRSEWARKCWEELKGKGEERESKWESRKEIFIERKVSVK